MVHRRIESTVLAPLSWTRFGCQVDRLLRALGLCLIGLVESLHAMGNDLPPSGPLGLVWEANLATQTDYRVEVEALVSAYEVAVGRELGPGTRSKVGLKVNTRGGRGLSTSPSLLRAVIASLELRGYRKDSILIVDYSGHKLRAADIMPPVSDSGQCFEGSPVLALDSGDYYDPDWFYDSPLPPALQQGPQLLAEGGRRGSLGEGIEERKSYLAEPLLFEVDFWINLAVGVDDPALGVDGVLASATLWNVSNSHRFLVNQATASAAVAEIAAIPELAERLVLHLVSLEAYQFIGGPFFNAIYTRSEPRLWLSSDPVALDRLLYDRMNAMRRLEGFPEIDPLPRQLLFAASLGLGEFERSRIRIEEIKLKHPETKTPVRERPAPRYEQPPNWLQRLTPW